MMGRDGMGWCVVCEVRLVDYYSMSFWSVSRAARQRG